MSLGYLDTPVNKRYKIPVDDTHTLHVEEGGKEDGLPVLFLHGGPGGSISEKSRRFFDPEKYRMILFDQRGTGKSTPFLSLENNTPFHSVADIETIRQALDIDKMVIFGGSYGSTLALAYAMHYPENVLHLVLRGVFLGRQEDIAWLYEGGVGQFYPEEFLTFRNFLPAEQRAHIVQAYYALMTGEDKDLAEKACKSWSDWESGLVTLIPEFNEDAEIKPSDLSIGLLEAHYFANQLFWPEDNYLLNRAYLLNNIPIDIVHGRYDVDCRPSGAYELHTACPQSHLHLIEGGAHSPYEAPMMKRLIEIMDSLTYTKY